MVGAKDVGSLVEARGLVIYEYESEILLDA